MNTDNTLLIPKLTPKGDVTVLTFVELPLPNRKIRQNRNNSFNNLHMKYEQQNDPRAQSGHPILICKLDPWHTFTTFTYNSMDASYSIPSDMLDDGLEPTILYNGVEYACR